MRKLCTNEVGGLKMKNNEKNAFFNFLKNVFFLLLFLAAPLALHFKDYL
jgi:hypothetical protein